MKKSDRIKQNEFMKAYEPIHARFELFCQARSSFIMDQEDLMNESITRAYNSWSQIGYNKESETYFVEPIENPECVDERRAEVGLRPIAEYVKSWGIIWDIEKHKLISIKN